LSENTDAAADAATATAAASDVKVGVGATRVGDAKAAAPEDQTDAAATADNDKKNKNDGDDVDDTIDLSSGVPGMVDQVSSFTHVALCKALRFFFFAANHCCLAFAANNCLLAFATKPSIVSLHSFLPSFTFPGEACEGHYRAERGPSAGGGGA
jgi:hypothetical protein